MESMNTVIRSFIEEFAPKLGCPKPLVEFANVSDIPTDNMGNFPYEHAIAIATPLEPHVIAELENGPTLEYYNKNIELSKKLQVLEETVCDMLHTKGYEALSLNNKSNDLAWSCSEESSKNSSVNSHPLTHKFIAAHAGLGWIGKNGLIITKHYGPAVRLSTILTDAPVDCCTEVFLSRCARCMECINLCPAHAIDPFEESHRMDSQNIVDIDACMDMCHTLTKRNFGVEADICGLCIYACPYTKAYLQRNGIIKY